MEGKGLFSLTLPGHGPPIKSKQELYQEQNPQRLLAGPLSVIPGQPGPPAHGDTAYSGLCPPHQPTTKIIHHRYGHRPTPRLILLPPEGFLVMFR